MVKKVILLISLLALLLSGFLIYNSQWFINTTMKIKRGGSKVTCVKYSYRSEYKDNQLKINITFSNINENMIEISGNIIPENEPLIKLKLQDKDNNKIAEINIPLSDLKTCNNGVCTVQKTLKLNKSQVRKIELLSPEYAIPICNPKNANSNDLSKKNTIVVYYSNGGNTKNVAEYIAKILKCDIAEIKSEEAYKNQKNILELKDLVQRQIDSNYIPKIQKIDISKYDVIFIGSPVWRSHISLPVKSFLLANNFENKILIPFYTFGGKGDKYRLDDEIRTYSKASNVLPSFITIWNGVAFLERQILQWLNEVYL